MNKIRPEIQWLAPQTLLYERSYQRIVSESWVKWIADNFDYRLCEPITVAKNPNGQYAIIDGLHRIRAAVKAGISSVPCRIVDAPDEQTKASLFVELSQSRRRLVTRDEIKAAAVAGDPIAVSITQILARHNIQLAPRSSGSNPRNINAGATLRDTIEAFGEHALDLAFTCVDYAWPEDGSRFQGSVFSSVARVLVHVGKETQSEPDAAMARKYGESIGRKTLRWVANKAEAISQHQAKTGRLAWANAIIEAHNYGRRTGRIPWIISDKGTRRRQTTRTSRHVLCRPTV